MHPVCLNCLNRYAEMQVFGGNTAALKCLHSEACNRSYSERTLQTYLVPATYRRLVEIQAREAAVASGLDDFKRCYSCAAEHIVDEALTAFKCSVCTLQTCRKCGKRAHMPYRCDELDEDKVSKARTAVEEAMTQARLRICPNEQCKQPFIKVDGCNRVICSCNTYVCYVCRSRIPGYEHFCSSSNSGTHKVKDDDPAVCAGCNKCKLHTQTLEDDRRAMLQAAVDVSKRLNITIAAAEGAVTGTGPAPLVDVNQLLEGGAMAKK